MDVTFPKAQTESQNDRSLGCIPITNPDAKCQFVYICSPPATSFSSLPKAGIHLTAALTDGRVSELRSESDRFSQPHPHGPTEKHVCLNPAEIKR